MCPMPISRRMTESNRHREASHQARLSCPTDHFDLIHHLYDALNVACNLLGQLRVVERCQATFKYEHALIAFARDAPERRV